MTQKTKSFQFTATVFSEDGTVLRGIGYDYGPSKFVGKAFGRMFGKPDPSGSWFNPRRHFKATLSPRGIKAATLVVRKRRGYYDIFRKKAGERFSLTKSRKLASFCALGWAEALGRGNGFTKGVRALRVEKIK